MSILQKKEEHKFINLSSGLKNEEITLAFTAVPTPDKTEVMERDSGWQNEDLAYVDVVAEVDYLTEKVASLTHQVDVFKLTEQARRDEDESYRLKLVSQALREQQRLAEVEPTPLLLTRGAHATQNTTHLSEKQRVHIDWLSFTAKETPDILQQFALIFLEDLRFENMSRGMAGYKSVTNISLNGEQIGLIGYGSSHGKNLFTLTGTGCALIKDWDKFKYWIELLENYSITRLDLALDFYSGEITHDIVINAYNNNRFKVDKSAKSPSISQQGTVDGLGRNRGRTIKIGGRKSSKFIRCYEKGLERFAKLFSLNNIMVDDKIDWVFKNYDCHELDPDNIPEGTNILNWYRLEIQYGNADRILKTDMLLERDTYFAGAYPYCMEVLKMTESKKPDRIPNNLETDIEIMFKHMRDQYGSFLTTIRASGIMTDAEIMNKACSGKISQRIIKAGGLEIIKPYSPK